MSDFDAASTAKDRSTSASCPSRETLLDFLNDRLPENEVDHVVQHVEYCAKCQRSLDVLGEKTGIHNRLPNIEGFRIEAELGRGGMGSVYLAQRVADDHVVAIKVLPEEYLNDQERRQRFSREIETLSRLSHPNIVQVLQAGFSQQQPYFVMEYLSGLTLGQFTRSLPLAPKVATEIIRLVATAVQFAHEHQVVHRDLKPSNIILTPCSTGTIRVGGGDGPERCYDIRLLDFSLAKEVDQETLLTRTGEILGTLGYMAPEQVLGGEVGPAADIYACGILLYELLSGRTPHQAANLPELIHQIRHAEPISLRALVPTIPKDLETICEKCLEKEPGKRYATAAELAADLEACGRARKITARPVSAIRKVLRWAYRRPATTTAIASATILLLSGLATTGWMLRQSHLANLALREEQNRTLVESSKVNVLNETLVKDNRRFQNLASSMLDELYYPNSLPVRLEIMKEITIEVEKDADSDSDPSKLWNAYRANLVIVQDLQRQAPLPAEQMQEVVFHYEKAIEFLDRYESSPSEVTKGEFALFRAELHGLLANSFRKNDEQDRAIELYEKALQVYLTIEQDNLVISPEQTTRKELSEILFRNFISRSKSRVLQLGSNRYDFREINDEFKDETKELGDLILAGELLDSRDYQLYEIYCQNLSLMADSLLAANNPMAVDLARQLVRVWLDAPGCWKYTPSELLACLGELCEQSDSSNDRKLLVDCLRRNLQADHRIMPEIQAVLHSERFERLVMHAELESAIKAARNPKARKIPDRF